MRTDKPLLISITETGFQLSLRREDVAVLIRDGDLTAVTVRGQILVTYDSVVTFARRLKRSSVVTEIAGISA